MAALGNGCRGMKSPPLLVAALVACIIVLGFNYRIASSRSVDLQSRIMELEGRFRRAAAERGAVELKKNEFQGELKKQMEQIEHIQSLHNVQLENTNKIHRDEKAMLMNNITLNEKLIQNLQEHLKGLQKEYGKLQADVYEFQKNQTNLQRKFTYDMSQCINQMKELKEQCEERIEEITKKGPEIPQYKEEKDKNDHVNIQVPTVGQPEAMQQDLTKQGNESQEKLKYLDSSLKLEATPIIKNVAELDYYKLKGTDSAVAIHKEDYRKEELPVDQYHAPMPAKPSTDPKELPPEPRIEQNISEVRNGKVAAERRTDKPVVPSDGNQAKADDEVEREHLLNDDLQDDLESSKAGEFGIKRENQENKGVDYNLDVNEAESETDKQAALVDQQNKFNVQNLEDPIIQNRLFKLGDDYQRKLNKDMNL